MGQYYLGVNVDKKEFISPHKYDCGAKLLEFGYIDSKLTGNKFTSALHSLVENEWKGDRVYIVGDYADLNVETDADENWISVLKDVYKEFPELGKPDTEGYEQTLYGMVQNDFKEISDTFPEGPFKRFIYNKATKEYIDLKYLPKEWDYEENGEKINVSIDPLMLLLAIGNDRGGGDYHAGLPSFDDVGRWVATSRDIGFCDEVIEGFTEYKPDFHEDRG